MNTKNVSQIIYMLLAFNIVACKKEISPVLPNNKEAAGLNFYSASSVLLFGNSGGIYMNKLPQDPRMDSVAAYFFNGTAVVYYSNYEAGKYKIHFADPTNTVVLDTTMDFLGKSNNCIYFADLPVENNASVAYTTVAVQEEREEVPDGQVAVRFIHLSPDAGDLTVGLEQADGTINDPLSGAIHFLEVTPYQYLDGATNTGGLLRFSFTNTANGATVITGVPFNPGRRYVVVISGFVNDQQRQINREDSNGNIEQTYVTVPRNFRAIIRRIY